MKHIKYLRTENIAGYMGVQVCENKSLFPLELALSFGLDQWFSMRFEQTGSVSKIGSTSHGESLQAQIKLVPNIASDSKCCTSKEDREILFET